MSTEKKPTPAEMQSPARFRDVLLKFGLAPYHEELQQKGVVCVEQLAALTAEQLAEITGHPVEMIKVLLRQIQSESGVLRARRAERLASSPAAALAGIAAGTTLSTPSPQRPASNPNDSMGVRKPMSTQEKRLKLIQEILQTELSYNAMLGSALADFLGPLEDQRVLDATSIDIIFGGLSELRAFSSRVLSELAQELQLRPSDPMPATVLFPFFDDDEQSVMRNSNGSSAAGSSGGDVRRRRNETAAVIFTNVIVKMVQANRLITKLSDDTHFVAVLEECTSALAGSGRSALESLLATPFQRVCRYVLLLKELHQQTDSNHPDAVAVTRTFDCVSRLVKQINDAKRLSDRLFQLDENITGNLDVLRETSDNLPMPSEQPKHRWVFHTGHIRTASRCLHCLQFFRWPKDSECMTCLRCAALVHKYCTRHLQLICQTPSLLNARHRRFIGDCWNGLTYCAQNNKSRAKPCSVFLCSDCLIITEPTDLDINDNSVPNRLVTLVRWWSGAKNTWIQVRRSKPKHLLLIAPRDASEHHLFAPSFEEIATLSDLVQRLEITKLEFTTQQQLEQDNDDATSLLPPPPAAAAASSISSSSLSHSQAASSDPSLSSSASSATTPNTASPPLSPRERSGTAVNRFLLPTQGFRFSCNSTTTVPREGGGEVIGYVIQALFDGQPHAIVVTPAVLKQFHRSLRARLLDTYTMILTPKGTLPKQRKLYSTAPFRQQKNCRTIAAWFNCILAIDRSFFFIQEFFDSVWSSSESGVKLHSFADSLVESSDAASHEKSLPTTLFEQEPFSLPTLGPVCTCLFDFEAENENELQAKQGEVFRVLSVNGEWSQVIAVSGAGIIGYLPSNYLSEPHE